MSSDWVKVYSTEMLFRAEMIKSMLEEEQIKTFLINKKDSMHTHLTIGEVELFVDDEHVLKAKHLITKFEE